MQFQSKSNKILRTYRDLSLKIYRKALHWERMAGDDSLTPITTLESRHYYTQMRNLSQRSKKSCMPTEKKTQSGWTDAKIDTLLIYIMLSPYFLTGVL